MIKISAVCVISSCVSLLLKKHQAESAFILGTCTAIFVLFYLIELYQQITIQVEYWERMLSFSGEYFIPLMKCLGISVVTQFGVNLCKDAGQGAVATSLELCGSVASLCCILPLLDHLFTLIEELL